MEISADANLTELAGRIRANGSITEEEAMTMRRTMYMAGDIGRDQAQFLIALHRDTSGNHPAWDEFYVLAMTDHFFWYREQDGPLKQDDTKLLDDLFGFGDGLQDPVQLRLLLNIMFRAKGAPEQLRVFALKSIKYWTKRSDSPVFGTAPRQVGALSAGDVEAIRKVIYDGDGGGVVAMGRDEAEMLFELEEATAGAENHPDWRPLFLKALTMQLVFSGMDHDRIEAGEAAWLAEQIRADGSRDEIERALLSHLKTEVERIHSDLDPVFAKFDL